MAAKTTEEVDRAPDRALALEPAPLRGRPKGATRGEVPTREAAPAMPTDEWFTNLDADSTESTK